MKIKCDNCGQEHDAWPALAFATPAPYNDLTKEEKANLGQLKGDFCVITYPDQTDRFIRCILRQKVIDHCQNLEYGIWVSVSEKSYQDYYNNFSNDNHGTQYFGWLFSKIPEYENTLAVPTTVITQTGKSRPEVFPHRDFDHPFVRDYYNGITRAEAERRISAMIESNT
jgi:hypothetical protein